MLFERGQTEGNMYFNSIYMKNLENIN
jgi:hypothetical protein